MKTNALFGITMVGIFTVWAVPAKAGVSVDVRIGLPFPIPPPPVVVAAPPPAPCPPPVVIAPPPVCPPPVVVARPPVYACPPPVVIACPPIPLGRPVFVPPGRVGVYARFGHYRHHHDRGHDHGGWSRGRR